MNTTQKDGESITERATRATEAQMQRHDRRATDKQFEIIKPVATWMICGTIAGGLWLWYQSAIQETKITFIIETMRRIEEKENTDKNTVSTTEDIAKSLEKIIILAKQMQPGKAAEAKKTE